MSLFNHYRLKYALLFAALGMFSACASTAERGADVPSVEQASTVQDPAGADGDLASPDLPKLELDAALLEMLLLANFASYSGNWSQAASSALDAALVSRDFRVARLATLLALRAKKFEEASRGASLWAELQNDSKEARSTLLLAQLGAGDVDAAYLGFQLSQGDLSVDEHIREVAGVLVRQDNAEAAVGLAQRYVEEHPDSAQVALSSAYVAENFRRDELAEQWLEQALALDPEWDLAAQMKVRILRKQGKEEERAKYIEQFVAEHPSSVGMRINHAAELARQEQFAEALALMQGVIRDDSENVAALSYSAALAQQLEQTDLAKQFYQQALKVDPGNEDVRWALAGFAVREKKYEQAERLYQQIDSRQNFFRAQLQVANMRYYTRGLEGAISTLRALEPKTEEEYVDRATTRHYLLLQDHQYEEAYGAINETLVYLPENMELVYARALVAAELNELEIAESDLRSIIAKFPDHANALNALGYTLADQTERFEEARELVVKALELRPNDAHILDSMGWVLYRLDDFEGAISYLKKAYEKAPEVEIAAHLGEVLWEHGDTSGAREIWLEGFVKDALNPLLMKTLERYGVNLETP